MVGRLYVDTECSYTCELHLTWTRAFRRALTFKACRNFFSFSHLMLVPPQISWAVCLFQPPIYSCHVKKQNNGYNNHLYKLMSERGSRWNVWGCWFSSSAISINLPVMRSETKIRKLEKQTRNLSKQKWTSFIGKRENLTPQWNKSVWLAEVEIGEKRIER